MEEAYKLTLWPLLSDPYIPFRLLRMSLASCKVFRPRLAASSARALAASARARSWSAVCKHMAYQRPNQPRWTPSPLTDQAQPGSHPETRQHPAGWAWASRASPALSMPCFAASATGVTLQTQLTLGWFQILPQGMKQPANQTDLLFDLAALQKFLHFKLLPSHVISEVLIIF